MAQVLHRRGRVQLRLDVDERLALLHVVDALIPTVAEALQSPHRAYEDDQHQAEFDRWVRPDIERSRDGDIVTMRDSLAAGEDTIVLTEPNAYAWLRAINHLRLAAAALLGIDNAPGSERLSTEQQERPEYRMFTLLSWLQEEFVAALEA